VHDLSEGPMNHFYRDFTKKLWVDGGRSSHIQRAENTDDARPVICMKIDPIAPADGGFNGS